MNYWLFKTEPTTFSWSHLLKAPDKITHWEGVRNYQARNYLKSMKTGDMVLFYHSIVEPLAIFGICSIVKEAYPDKFQFDEKSKYFDPKNDPANPRWWMVDIKYKMEFSPPVTRDEIKSTPGLADMELLKKGSRLSIQPVTKSEYDLILSLRKK
ncbi:MAG: EVE domain-containing protein [Spirochaetia bacterium]|nr:EVE domain-containing protein [Spirochaetia bacterium]